MTPRAPLRIARALGRLRRAEEGAAVVEFAFVLPLFMALIAGVFDAARMINATLQVRAAAQAGALLAQTAGYNDAAISTAVSAATPLHAAETSQQVPKCIQAGQLQDPLPNGKCPGNLAPGSFVSVTASAPFKAVVDWTGIPWPTRVTYSAWVRVT